MDNNRDNQLRDAVRKAFADAAEATFRKMIMLELSPLSVEAGEKETWDFSGTVNFSGDIAGNCILRLSEATAREAITRLAGELIEKISEVSDGVGELANMISGNAKAALQEYTISLSFPEVIMGKDHEKAVQRHSNVISLYFTSEIGAIAVIAAYSDPILQQGT
jgi:chemotaxis protein CheX